MSRSVFYLWCILLVVYSSRTHIGYGARIDPQRSSNVSEDLDPVKVAQEKCQEYSQVRHDMKRILRSPSIRIQYAQKNEFPHMALIGTEVDEENLVEWICGGSLISPQYVLTAAHCNDPTNTAIEATTYWVLLGLTNKPDGDVRTSQYRDNAYRIVERINHPENRLPKFENDIALLKLDRPAVLNSAIQPLCLALPPNAKYNALRAIATGWGQTEPGGRLSERLKKVSLSLLDDSKCIKAFENETMLSKGFDAKSMICAGAKRPSDGDTCMGDGGGPLHFPIDSPEYTGMWFQEGITSFGSSYCDDPLPGIYTRVSYFLPWIQSIVWPAYRTSSDLREY